MIRIPKVTTTMRDLDRLKCIQGLIDGQLNQTAVAARLGLTTRQVRRLNSRATSAAARAAPRGRFRLPAACSEVLS